MARASTECVCVVAREAPSPPPLRSLFPWWRRDRVCSPLWGSGRGGVDVFLAPRRAALALRRKRPIHHPPPPRLSFPWLFPSALVVPLAARSRLVVNVSEEEWQM